MSDTSRHDETGSSADDGSGEDEASHSRSSIAVGAGIAAFMLLALFWAAIFSGVFTGTNPDTLKDRDWAAKAGRVCEPASDLIAGLPNATTAGSAAHRADLLDQGTDALDTMYGQLSALPVPSAATDRTVTTGWLEDWKIYLQDRRNFADALRKDPLAKPLLTETHGGWDTDAIDAMARANDIPSCATPGDM